MPQALLNEAQLQPEFAAQGYQPNVGQLAPAAAWGPPEHSHSEALTRLETAMRRYPRSGSSNACLNCSRLSAMTFVDCMED